MSKTTDKIKTFPLTVNGSWLDRLEKAVKLSSEGSKHDFILRAAEKEMDRLEKESRLRK